MNKPSPLRLLIFGSCVSRDILNDDTNARRVALLDYYARSSLASIALKPLDLPIDFDRIDSAFQRRMVVRDVQKRFIDDVGELSFDILLIDLIDERFNLFVTYEAAGCTLSSELYGSGFCPNPAVGTVIVSGSEEFWQLWEIGWQCLVSRLRVQGRLDRVRVNQVFWGTHTETGSDFEPTYTRTRIDAANRLLKRMYERMRTDLPLSQFLRFDAPLTMGASHHRWGLSPFHYVDAYYRDALRQLTNNPMATVQQNLTSQIGRTDWRGSAGERQVLGATDYSSWEHHVYTYETVDSAIRSGFRQNGVHRLPCGRSTLDFLLQGVEYFNSGSSIGSLLVAFSGAVSDRRGKRAPFFSGLGIARSLQLPLLAVSDPTLALDGEIPLAWYVGNDSTPQLPECIASILDAIALRLQCRLVLFGGSGGGYAVLSQLSFLREQAIGLVWNPQTSIGEYVPDAISTYLRVAFPALRAKIDEINSLGDAERRTGLKRLLSKAGITDNLASGPTIAGHSLLYLQSRTDWHVARHAAPVFKLNAWTRLSSRSFKQNDAPVACWFGDWGRGHVAPPKELVEKALSHIIRQVPVEQIAEMLDAGSPGADKLISWFAVDRQAGPITLEVQVDGTAIAARCAPLHSVAVDYPIEYAFYLLVDGQRSAVSWYGSQPSVRFEMPESAREVKIVAFVRDSLGNMINSTTDVSIDREKRGL